MTRTALGLLLAMLLLATPADAQPTPSPDAFSFEHRALKMAELLWRPACGALAVSWEVPPAWEEGTGWAYKDECTIHLDATSEDLAYWEPLCTTVLHEAGHIVGRGHARRGLMRPDRVYSITEGKVVRRSRTRGSAEPTWQTFVAGGNWRCRRSGVPWLRAHVK